MVATLHERADDPVWVTSFTLYGKGETYLRTLAGGSFGRETAYKDLVASHAGKYAAGVLKPSKGRTSVNLIGLFYAGPTPVLIVRRPLDAKLPYWSRDGKVLVLTVHRDGTTVGFATVGTTYPIQRTARVVMTPGVDRDASFRWAPDGRSLVADHGSGVRTYRTDGRVLRTLGGVGPLGGGEDVFSPSGRKLLTGCPYGDDAPACMWDAVTGRPLGRIPAKVEGTEGWWDENNLIVLTKKGTAYQVVVIDSRGTVLRVLADMSKTAKEQNRIYLSYTPKE
ncbi:TolB family protein [Streptosporangium sandarakinum]|uniref:TolB family protein n=1 Tax=Streptosporangium sandarakinum TaxID=1260955 RepID=UPI003D8A50DF